MDQARITARPLLFELAVEALHAELVTRLSQLHARKADIGRLSGLADYLNSRGWKARADVATHQHAGAVLRLWINVGSQQELTSLLEDIGGQGIDVARQSFNDVADILGYELSLSDRVRVLLRVGICYLPPAKAAA